MKDYTNLKLSVLSQLKKLIDSKVESLELAYNSAKESRNEASKSTAGDKHETGRAMVQIEMDNIALQLTKALKQKVELDKITPETIHKTIEHGSLVITNQGNYFISIGIGNINDKLIKTYAISIASPLGQSIKNKKAGDKIIFQENELLIIDII